MGLGQVNAGCARLLPEIGNGIQPDKFRPVRNIQEQDVQDLQQQIRIVVIKIYLVGAERCPDFLFALGRLIGCQQRQRTRPDNPGQVFLCTWNDEILAVL